MAEERRRGSGVKCTAVPVAHGGTERGAAKGAPPGGRAQHEIKEARHAEKTMLFCRDMVSLGHEK